MEEKKRRESSPAVRVKAERTEKGLYKVTREEIKREEKRAELNQEDPFVVFIKNTAAKHPSENPAFKLKEDQAEALNFLGYDVKPQEVWSTAAYLGRTIALILGLFLLGFAYAGIISTLISLTGFDITTIKVAGLEAGPYLAAIILFAIAYIFMPSLMVALLFMLVNGKVENEKMNALAYAPEIINYLVMSLRITPNLEKAVQFAASHGRGKISDDFKKIIWNVQLGKYYSVEEGIDELAYKWGPFNEEFKQALIMIRGSVLEPDVVRRTELLEKAVNDLLEGSQEKMEGYARALHQPTVLLYYFGILLPLMLAIILPIAGSLGNVKIDIIMIALAYNFFLPLLIYLFGTLITSKRPPTYTAPEIPDDFPGLPPKGMGKLPLLNILVPYVQVAIFVFIGFAVTGFFLDNGFYEYQKATSFGLKDVGNPVNLMVGSNGLEFRALKEDENASAFSIIFTLPPKNTFLIFGIIIGLALSVSIYLHGKFSEKLRVQREIRAMEGEFKDAVYVLASRLAENRPMEDALRHAISFLPKSVIANKLFKKILENISTMGMTIETAIFDPVFGALKNMPSKLLLGGMKTLVNASELGSSVAARSLIGLSVQIRNSEKVDLNLRKLLADVTSLLGTMATFVAPIVLAVVGGMQGMIASSIAGAAQQGSGVGNLEEAGVQAPGFGALGAGSSGLGKEAAQLDPQLFTIVLGVYLIEVVVLLLYFNSQVEEPGNKIYAAIQITKSLPIAAILFSVISIIAALILAGAGS